MNHKQWRKVLKRKSIVDTFNGLEGEQLKSAPKGYVKNHEAIDLLRYKQFLFVKYFSDKEVLGKNFSQEVSKGFKAIRPFFDHMSEVLTTNGNGESIL